MHPNSQDNSIQDDEIDLREMFALLSRRWRWVVGGGLLGLVLAVGAHSLKPRPAAQVRTNLIIDVAQGPCFSRFRRLNTFTGFTNGMSCAGEFETMRLRLDQLAKQLAPFVFNVDQLAFDANRKQKSGTQLVLSVTAPANLAPKVASGLAQIQQDITQLTANSYLAIGLDPIFGSEWIQIQEPTKIHGQKVSLSRSLAVGLLVGLVVGSGSALIADRRTNRVYSQSELLRRLGHPLRLGLPSGPWTSSAVPVLVGQLATQLDQALSWRVLSIARQHDAVLPLTQLLQQQGGPALQCNSADPLLAAVLHMPPTDKPTGLLLVVEPGFNSARALEEARLLISQMRAVQAVGVVFIGAPLPDEFSSSAAG